MFVSAHKNAFSAKAERMKELEQLRIRHETKHQLPTSSNSRQQISPEKTQKENSLGSTEKTEPLSKFGLNDSPIKISLDGPPLKVRDSYAGLEQVKPIRVSPPKPGRLYPCLSDIEMTTDNEREDHEEEPNKNCNTTRLVKILTILLKLIF